MSSKEMCSFLSSFFFPPSFSLFLSLLCLIEDGESCSSCSSSCSSSLASLLLFD